MNETNAVHIYLTVYIIHANVYICNNSKCKPASSNYQNFKFASSFSCFLTGTPALIAPLAHYNHFITITITSCFLLFQIVFQLVAITMSLSTQCLHVFFCIHPLRMCNVVIQIPKFKGWLHSSKHFFCKIL